MANDARTPPLSPEDLSSTDEMPSSSPERGEAEQSGEEEPEEEPEEDQQQANGGVDMSNYSPTEPVFTETNPRWPDGPSDDEKGCGDAKLDAWYRRWRPINPVSVQEYREAEKKRKREDQAPSTNVKRAPSDVY